MTKAFLIDDESVGGLTSPNVSSYVYNQKNL